MSASKRILAAMERIHESRGILSPTIGIGCATGYVQGILEHKKSKKLTLKDIADAMECGAKHAERMGTACDSIGTTATS